MSDIEKIDDLRRKFAQFVMRVGETEGDYPDIGDPHVEALVANMQGLSDFIPREEHYREIRALKKEMLERMQFAKERLDDHDKLFEDVRERLAELEEHARPEADQPETTYGAHKPR